MRCFLKQCIKYKRSSSFEFALASLLTMLLVVSAWTPPKVYASDLADDMDSALTTMTTELDDAPVAKAQGSHRPSRFRLGRLVGFCLLSLAAAATNPLALGAAVQTPAGNLVVAGATGSASASTYNASWVPTSIAQLRDVPEESYDQNGLLYASDDINQQAWKAFKDKYNKTYADAGEEAVHYRVFVEGLKEADQWNDGHQAQYGSRVFGINEFSDRDPKSFKSTYLNALPPDESEEFEVADMPLQADSVVPASTDYRNILTPVKNQGVCGSCWAFSAVANLEARIAMKTGNKPILSTQQVVSCDTSYNYGCNGGWPEKAFAYMKRNGLQLEERYPYESGRDANTRSCAYNRSDIQAVVTKFQRVGSSCSGSGCKKQEANLKAFVAQHGPVSVLINGDPLQRYRSGILSGGFPNRRADLNHAVQLVGFGVEGNGQEYWVIRNSWGAWWGESGYARLAMGENPCGIIDEVFYVADAYFGPDAVNYLSAAAHAVPSVGVFIVVAVGARLMKVMLD